MEPPVTPAEMCILHIVQKVVPNARFERITTGTSWSFWIITPTDKERDIIKADSELLGRLLDAASDAGFGSFTLQSQETVDRDHAGSWLFVVP